MLDTFKDLLDLKEISAHLETEIIVGISGAIFYFVRGRLARWIYVPALWKAYGVVTVCVVPLYFTNAEPNSIRFALFLFAAVAVSFALSAIFKGYEDVGFGSAFAKTEQGIGFERSLRLADGPLDFLGIGADKLSKTPEFDDAMSRCGSSGRTVRMLLSPPNHPLLQTLAKRNGVNPDQYSKNVVESLRRIARVKSERALDIQVRFYPLDVDKDLQIFRLMFVNNMICLWSWTVWGKHLGADNPQVVLLNRERINQTGAYNAFHAYFERLWGDPKCQQVDLQAYFPAI